MNRTLLWQPDSGSSHLVSLGQRASARAEGFLQEHERRKGVYQMKKYLILAAAAIAVVSLAASAYAQGAAVAPPAGQKMAQPRLDVERLLPNPAVMNGFGDQLGLTPNQKQALKDLVLAKHQQMQPLREQLPPLHNQLVDLMLVDSLDVAKAKQLTDQIMGIRNQMAKVGIDFWGSVRTTLTAEQNAKLTQILKDRVVKGFGLFGGPDEAGRQRQGQPGMNQAPGAGTGDRQRMRPDRAGGANNGARARNRVVSPGAAANP